MTYRNTDTMERFKINSFVSWEYSASAAGASWTEKSFGKIIDIDHLNKCVTVEDEEGFICTLDKGEFKVESF